MIEIVVAGFHKCGTSSLFEMLGTHPDLCTQNVGQLPPFLGSDSFRDDFEQVRRDHYPGCPEDAPLLLRDNRLAQDVEALGRLRQLSPGATLVFLVRDPVARAHSAYWHAVERGFETELSFDDVVRRGLADEETAGVPLQRYLSMGLYHRQLEAVTTVFPRDQVVVVDAARLKAAPQEVCQDVFRAAGLRPFDVEAVHLNRATAFRSRRIGRLVRSEAGWKRAARRLVPTRLRLRAGRLLNRANSVERPRPAMTEEHRQLLTSLYAEENKRLRRDYGISFDAPA